MRRRAATDELERLIGRHQSMVYSIALRMLGDTGAAEEVAQDVFLELSRVLERMEGEEHTRRWLCRVVVCRATDALRRRRTAGPALVDEVWEDERYPSAAETAMSAVGARLEELVLRLPAELRAAVVLRYGEEMGPDEIAAVLGRPLPTVKSDLRRGLALLRQKAAVVLKEYVR